MNVDFIMNTRYKRFSIESLVFLGFFISFLVYFFLNMRGLNSNFNFEVIIILLTLVIGLSIIFYVNFSSYDNLYKLGFIIILCFGLIALFLNPILITPDEMEHYARSELISEGDFIPSFTDNGYSIQSSFYSLLYDYNHTFFQVSHSDVPFNSSLVFYDSVFAHNPFFGYLISGLGIVFAKFLSLSVLDSLYLGRFFNLVFYTFICTYALRKVNYYKIPLLVVSCLPLSISQAASFSIDGMIIGFSILSVALLVNMYKCDDFVSNKELFGFFILTSLIGVLKFTNIFLLFLIFIVPKSKFKDKNFYYLSRVLPFVLMFGVLLYCGFYSSPKYYLSYRLGNIQRWGVNTTGQLNFIVGHPVDSFNLFAGLPLDSWRLVVLFFHFHHTVWSSFENPVFLIAGLYFVFYLFVSFFIPDDLHLDRMSRLKVFIVIFLIYYGTYFVQYISWTSVGASRVMGVNSRYFIPILFLIPMVFNLNFLKSDLKDNLWYIGIIIVFVLVFIVGSVFMLVSSYY